MHYRIKTQEEFEKEYGFLNGAIPIRAGWSEGMEYLLGLPITEEQYQHALREEKEDNYLQIDDWSISLDMIHVSSFLLNSYNVFKKMFGYEDKIQI